MMHLIFSGLRAARRAPGFSSLAAIPLAVGFAAAMVISSVGVRLYYHSLPVASPERLVVLRSPGPTFGSVEKDTEETVFSFLLYKSLAASAGPDLDLAARSGDIVGIQASGDASRVRAEFVSGNYFSVLGLQPASGRLIEPADDASAESGANVVLSHAFAAAQYGSAPGALGRKVIVNGHPMLVIGVAPSTFFGVALGRTPDVFLPLRARQVFDPEWRGFRSRRSSWLNLFGRTRDTAKAASFEARLQTIYQGLLADEAPEIESQGERAKQEFLARRLSIVPANRGIDTVQRAWAEPVRVLLIAATAIFGIAWFNFGALLSVRLLRRRPAIAIQYSLGARRRDIIVPLASEVCALTFAGALGGVLLACLLHALLSRLLPPEMAGDWMPAWPDPMVVAAATLVSAVLGMAVALVAVAALRKQTEADLRTASSRQAGFRMFQRTSQVLLSFQGAGSVVLVIIALLLSVSLHRLTSQDMGIRKGSEVVTMSVSPGLANYSGAQSYAYYDRALAALRSVPGVESAGLTSNPVLAGLNSFANVTVEGYHNTDQRFVLTGRNKVSTGFFATLGIPLLSGRYFEDADAGKSVVIVNRRFAKTFFNGSSPIGRHVAIGSGQGIVPDLEVVGVVDDYHQKRLREAPIPALFTPISSASSNGSAAFYVKARSSTSPSAISETLRRVDPAIAVHSIDTVEHLVAAAGATDRLLSWVAVAFAVISLLLAAMGILGLVQYAAQARQSEMAIRSALGASRQEVVWLLGRDTVALALAAATLGVLASAAVARLIESRLFGVTAYQVELYVLGAVSYIALAAAAAVLPALRGSEVDLTGVLRAD